jgi:hypothetical protein
VQRCDHTPQTGSQQGVSQQGGNEMIAVVLPLWEHSDDDGLHLEEPGSHPLSPCIVQKALSGPDAAEWQAAVDEEARACLALNVWEPCEMPEGRHALPTRFVLARKRDGRYNACLVAGGNRQRPGGDLQETFAVVCSYRTLLMILAVSAREGLVLRQFDICTAFLNGELEEEVYVRAPVGAEHLAVGERRVLRLRRALYGVRQAPRARNQCLERKLRAKGFQQSESDPSLGFCVTRVAGFWECSM